VVPYFLIALFAFNLVLLDHLFYRLTLALQITFYTLAITGYLTHFSSRLFWVKIPFSFSLVNLAALLGVARFVVGKKAGRAG
jgi:hypothetical protein